MMSVKDEFYNFLKPRIYSIPDINIPFDRNAPPSVFCTEYETRSETISLVFALKEKFLSFILSS